MNVVGFNEPSEGLVKHLFLYLREERMIQSELGSAAIYIALHWPCQG